MRLLGGLKKWLVTTSSTTDAEDLGMLVGMETATRLFGLGVLLDAMGNLLGLVPVGVGEADTGRTLAQEGRSPNVAGGEILGNVVICEGMLPNTMTLVAVPNSQVDKPLITPHRHLLTLSIT